MIPPLFFYQLAFLGLLWLCVLLHLAWPSRDPVSSRWSVEPETPVKSRRKRSKEPTPFVGLTHKPPCALCEHETSHPTPPPPVRPAPRSLTNRRPRQVDTSRHFCPHEGCDYRGWSGLGNLRGNGHPNGGLWRQFHCAACDSYFLEHHGTLFHGKRVAVELIVRVLACLAEGLGIRATARVFEGDANTVLQWLVEAAEQLRAFSRYFLCDVHVQQLQLEELYAVLRAVKAGNLSADEAITAPGAFPLLGVDGHGPSE
jgi:transposase-like protein